MITAEIWKKAIGYDNFEVSNLGRVRNIKLRLIKSQRMTPNGYPIMTLKENGIRNTEYVHRLVAKAFHPKSNFDGLQVNHIDENKENNAADNLEWCTPTQNYCHNGRAKRVGENHKLNSPLRKAVKNVDTGEVYQSVREAARQTGICNVSISCCLTGKQKHAGGYKWVVME